MDFFFFFFESVAQVYDLDLGTTRCLSMPHFKSRRYNIQNKTTFSYSRTLRVSNDKKKKKKRIPERELSSVVRFITFENQSTYKFKFRSPNTL